MNDEHWEQRRRTFECTAETYDRFRPRYPDALFDSLRVYADLAGDDAILEIGCGTGQATTVLASWGNPLVAVEPSQAMADLARLNLVAYENVEIRTTRFEDADLTPGSFGLVTSAQAFHWIDHATRYRRVADMLYAHGTIGLVWNTQVTPASHRPFFERVQTAYLEHAPEIAHKGEFRSDVDDSGLTELRDTHLCEDEEVRHFPWEWTLDRDEYLNLMSTHSPHGALDDDQRARLLAAIGEIIDAEFGGHVTEHYVAELLLGRKR